MSFSFQDHFIDLPQGKLALRSFGRADAPVVLVLGGISGGRKIYQADALQHGRGWWQGLVEHAGLQRYRLVAVDYCGGMGDSECQQVPGEVSEHAQLITQALLQLGIRQLHAVIGGSFGGCVAMELARSSQLDCQRLVVLGAAHRPTAQAVMIRSLQRDFIAQAIAAGNELRGVQLARALAMLSYRGARGLDERFPDPSQAVIYMHERAATLVASNPMRAVQLFKTFGPALDQFKIAPENLQIPTFVVSFADDYLAPEHVMDELVSRLPNCHTHMRVATLHGHDGFILDTASYGPQLKQFLEDA
ncbi:alpha/beta fold hydrolase [Pseudidiomarina homiensis]|uniref:alpha/beta fold hydrolase n=1 Tax=Pseudidiomarina homiensis TaxID=364198 RepID=UPI00215AD2F0|nr:alpha/beta fold hydrolase [Pseudidiomarina homiensis]